MKKSFISFVCLFVSALASCGGNNFVYDKDNFLPNGTEENPYQIVKEPVTIEIFAPHSSGQPEYKDLLMFKKLSQVTNLQFTFTTPDSSAYATRRGTVFNDGSYYPDLFLYSNPLNEQIEFAEKGRNIFVPLNADSYIDANGMDIGNVINNYMPVYKDLLEKNFNIDKNDEDALKTCTVADGKMYAAVSAKDVGRDLTYKLFINNAWIKRIYKKFSTSYCKLNDIDDAEDISTIDDYIGVLQDFYDYDANNNGSNTDEVPVSSVGMEYLRNHILSAYGKVTQYIEINDEHTEFTFNPLTDNYREYLKTARMMFKNGLMDGGTFSNKSTNDFADDGLKGCLGSFVAAAPYLVVGTKNDANLLDDDGKPYRLDREYSVVKPLISDINNVRRQWGFGYFQSSGACINAKSHFPREIARLLDIMYSELGVQLLSYGVENETFHWDDEAKTSWTFDVPEDWEGSQEDYRATITPNVGSGAGLYWCNDFVGKMNDDIITSLNSMSEVYRPYLKTPEPQNYHFNSSEITLLAMIQSQIVLQLPNYECMMIKGEGFDPFDDASWAKFKEDMATYATSVTGEKYEDIYNNMLARYK